LLWRSRLIPQYRARWAERFGYFSIPKERQQGIWLHAVSLGEFLAAVPLVKALLIHYPHLPITITSMTVTGSARIQKEFGDRVFHVYVPYDLPTVVQRFLNKIKPKIAIILETELWPNLLYYCAKKHIPIMLANARLSERSMKNYQRIARVTRDMLKNITLLAAHAHADAERFLALGLPKERCVVVGSIKFEIDNPSDIFDRAKVLRASFGSRPVWIAASTHQGEEEQILAAFKGILHQRPDTLLILVARHPERFASVKELCEKQGYSVVTRSSGENCTSSTQVFLGDTMGELKLLYAAADLAFVGGSLVSIGGHNVLEPIGLNIPTITGPQMFNFAEINERLLAAGALIQIQEAQQLTDLILDLFENSERTKLMQFKGEQVLAENRGALQKNLDLIESILEKKGS